MKDLIERLVAEYKANMITWHDIQDMVEAQVIIQQGFNTKDILNNADIRKVYFNQVNSILSQIERRLK